MNSVQQVRRPLVGAALSAAVGLAVQHIVGFHPLFLLGICSLIFALGCIRRTVPCAYLCFMLLAAAYGAVEQSGVSDGVCGPRETAEDVVVTGRVVDDPVQLSDQIQFRFKPDAVYRSGTWFSDHSVLTVYLRADNLDVAYGERWKIEGRRLLYAQPGSRSVGRLTASGDSAHRLEAAGFSLKGLCYRFRHRAARLLEAGLENDPAAAGLLQAMLLGYRRHMPDDLHQMFARTGTLHIFAISGLHVGVMAALLIALLKVSGVDRPRWGLWLIPALFVYVAATGMKPSAMRAFTMAAIYFAAPLAARKPDAPSSIALAALLLLAINPLQIDEPGFLLSFTVVSGIVMVHGFVARHVNGLRRIGWTGPLRQLSGPHPAAGALRAAGLLLITSLAAWLFSLPLTARFFNTVSPAALLCNPMMIPLTFFIVLTGCLTLLAGAFGFSLALLFAQANRVFIGLLIGLIRHAGEWAGAWFFVRSPSVAGMLLWYGGLLLVFTGGVRLRRAGLAVVTASVLLWGALDLTESRRGIQVVRSGDSAMLLKLPPDRQVLVTDGNPFYASQTIRLLRRGGVSRLDAIALSDSRADLNAVHRLQDLFRAEEVIPWNSEASRPHWLAGEGRVALFSGRRSRLTGHLPKKR